MTSDSAGPSAKQIMRRAQGLLALASHVAKSCTISRQLPVARELKPDQRFNSPGQLLAHIHDCCEKAKDFLAAGELAEASAKLSEAKGILLGSCLNVSRADCDTAAEKGTYP